MKNLGIINTVNCITMTLHPTAHKQSRRKYTEPIAFAHSCEKTQEFTLSEWSNFRSSTLKAPVVLNCT